VITLREGIDDAYYKVHNHYYDKLLEEPAEPVAAFFAHTSPPTVHLCLLRGEVGFERRLKGRPEGRNSPDESNDLFDVTLAEQEDDKELLDVHLDDRLAYERGAKERPERYEEMAARDTCTSVITI